jgi:hypothetical protein
MAQPPVPRSTLLVGRNRGAVVFDSIGPTFHFGQATKYGRMTKSAGANCPALAQPFRAMRQRDADCQCIAEPRFEIDKIVRNDKRNGL